MRGCPGCLSSQFAELDRFEERTRAVQEKIERLGKKGLIDEAINGLVNS